MLWPWVRITVVTVHRSVGKGDQSSTTASLPITEDDRGEGGEGKADREGAMKISRKLVIPYFWY